MFQERFIIYNELDYIFPHYNAPQPGLSWHWASQFYFQWNILSSEMFLQGPTKKHVVYAEDLTDNIYITHVERYSQL